MKFSILTLAFVVGQATARDAAEQKKARRAKRELQRKQQQEEEARAHNLRVNLAPQDNSSTSSSSSSTQKWRPEPRRFLSQRGNNGGGSKGGGSKGGGKNKPTFEPGCFDWGIYIRDRVGNPPQDYDRIRVSNGLMGRPIAYQGEKVPFTGFGATSAESADDFHESADGGAVFTKADGTGYYYASNSEEGNAEDGEFTGGVWVLEMDNNHDVINYYQTLSGTVDNCAGGRTPWDTWVSCEEEDFYGRCWQTDPAGVIPFEVTTVTPYRSNWEAFAWDDSSYPPRGYVTDDAEPADLFDELGCTVDVDGNIEQPCSSASLFTLDNNVVDYFPGAVVQFTPGEAGLECYNKESKADRWCTITNPGTYKYLKINRELGSNCGTIEWVDDNKDANSVDYRNSEGIDVTDGILRFVSKRERLLFTIDLEKETYCQTSTLEGPAQEPDNIRVLDDILYVCTDGRTPNGVFANDDDGWYALFQEIDYVTENAGLDFSEDRMVMYVAFQDSAVWQFWREDGLPFDAKYAKKCLYEDSAASNDMDLVLEPLIEDIAKDVVEDALDEL